VTDLRTSCQNIVAASQAPYQQLHLEANRLRAGVARGVLDVHEVWSELIVAAVLAGVPARDAVAIIRAGLAGAAPPELA
jgi:hypothetical protein